MQDMPEPVSNGSVLGFDYGLKRIGTAVGQLITRTATPLAVIDNQPATLWQDIEDLIGEWRPKSVIVGLPLSDDGSETEMSRHCRKFAQRIHGRSGLPVHLQDERLSSRAAAERFAKQRAAGMKRKKHGNATDSLAAQVLLEDWLNETLMNGDVNTA
jgi:putative Holliday junction resolvase